MNEAITTRIPDSVLPSPTGLSNRIKFLFWKIISPFFLWWQRALLKLGFLHHEGRQNFVLGMLAPGKSLNDFIKYLIKKGARNHFIAWTDDDQIVSVRWLENFERQYHLRVFSDLEIRGHYEYTPEAHGKLHMKEIGLEDRRDWFFNILGDWIVQVPDSGKIISHTIPATFRVGPLSGK